MALELLAGPIDITLPDGTPVLINTTHPVWHDAVGIVTSVINGTTNYNGRIIGLDGVARERNRETSLVGGNVPVHNMVTRGLGFLKGGLTPFSSNILDLHTLRPLADETIFPVYRPVTILADRWILASGTLVRHDVFTGSLVTECTLPVSIGAKGFISPGGLPNEVMIGGESGVAYRYNYVDRAVKGFTRRFGMACKYGVFYSPGMGVWITLSEGGSPIRAQMRIWADEVAPASLSAPAAQSSVLDGHVVAVKARLEGAHSDPCIGMPINWSVALGSGTVKPAQSMTDDDGYATTYLAAPPNATGDVQVNAEAVF